MYASTLFLCYNQSGDLKPSDIRVVLKYNRSRRNGGRERKIYTLYKTIPYCRLFIKCNVEGKRGEVKK